MSNKKSNKNKLIKKTPIYYNKRISKQNFHKKPYKNKNKDNFIQLINLYKIDKLKTEFIIYPYCSEKINFSIYLDKENIFKINKTLLNIIENKYKCEFKKDSNLIKKNHFVIQKNNPCKFIKYLLENLNNKRLWWNKNI